MTADREQRSSLKAGAPAASVASPSARKPSSHAEADKSAKDQSVARPPSSEQNRQPETTAKSKDESASDVKKTRRRLPPVPVDAEPATARPPRRIRSRSADSRVDEASVEKERLRRHLKLREVRDEFI